MGHLEIVAPGASVSACTAARRTGPETVHIPFACRNAAAARFLESGTRWKICRFHIPAQGPCPSACGSVGLLHPGLERKAGIRLQELVTSSYTQDQTGFATDTRTFPPGMQTIQNTRSPYPQTTVPIIMPNHANRWNQPSKVETSGLFIAALPSIDTVLLG